MEVRVHYDRPGKGTNLYVEDLVADDGRRLVTYTVLPPDAAQDIAAAMLRQHMVAAPVQLDAVRKHYLYDEYFSILEFLDPNGAVIGYYSDMVTRLRRGEGEYFITDLFLDVWLVPGQPPLGLDEDEFAAAAAAGLMTAHEQAAARAAYERVLAEAAAGRFPAAYIGRP